MYSMSVCPIGHLINLSLLRAPDSTVSSVFSRKLEAIGLFPKRHTEQALHWRYADDPRKFSVEFGFVSGVSRKLQAANSEATQSSPHKRAGANFERLHFKHAT